jgi:guanylate kinase
MFFTFMEQQKIVIITAPSGAGKTSITRFLLESFPVLAFSISATTRAPRSMEKDGVEYYFLSEKNFLQRISDDAFMEWEMVYPGKYYGTLKSEMTRLWSDGRVPVLDIDVKGAQRIIKQYPGQCLSIFITAPSIEILETRLRNRGTESEETIAIRMNKASYELTFQHAFDTIIVNDDLAIACEEAALKVRTFLGQKTF